MSFNDVTYRARTAREQPPERDRLPRRLGLVPPGCRALPGGFEELRNSVAPGAPHGGVREAA